MTFQCEDLRDFGLTLVPNTSPDYDLLLADIQRRIDRSEEPLHHALVGRLSPEKRGSSAILLNHSGKTIVEIVLDWRYEDIDGRRFPGVKKEYGGTTALVFKRVPSLMKIMGYWNTILPGSKRYVAEGEIAGDNTDVRAPEGDEILKGGGAIGHGGGSTKSATPIKSITLGLDGIFFSDGGFIGPNRQGLWEKITSEAGARLEVAKAARDGRARGLKTRDILAEIETITGPAQVREAGQPPPPPPRPRTQQANEIAGQRRHTGDDAAVEWLAAQANVRLPDFHKL